MSASQISSRKHDSLTGATSERESQVWEGAADSSIIEQEPSVAAGPVSSRTADDSFPVPSLPHIGQLWDVVVFVLVCWSVVGRCCVCVSLLVSCGTVLYLCLLVSCGTLLCLCWFVGQL